MSRRIFTSLLSNELSAVCYLQTRHGHMMRGLPPTHARSLQQKLNELKSSDSTNIVDIGLPFLHSRVSKEWQKEYSSIRRDKVYEALAREQKLYVDLDKCHNVWLKTIGPQHIRKISEHYGIFRDLFDNAYFHTTVPLEIYYAHNIMHVNVHYGNVVKPTEAKKQPIVSYSAPENTLWTLLMTTPDGNIINENNEYCHWFLGNIPGNKLHEGEEILSYFRPLPLRGIGYFRYIFVLYKQEKQLDYGEYAKECSGFSLKNRDWNTLEFYRKFQDYLTPAGLGFFQADWDCAVRDFYHEILDAPEPICEYDFPAPFLKRQEWFPKSRAFNTYMDRYKDPRDVMKRYLIKKLTTVNPFKKPDPPSKFPHAHPYEGTEPSWLRVEIKKDRLGWGRINDL